MTPSLFKFRSLPLSVMAGMLLASFSLAFWVNALWQQNEYAVYAPGRLKLIPLVTLLFAGAAYLVIQQNYPRLSQLISRQELYRQLLISLLAALLISWFWPTPVPVLQTPKTLELTATGEKNDSSSGSIVEIRGVRGLDGAEIPLDQFTLAGDWYIQNGRLVSEGKLPGSKAEYRDPLAGGVILNLRYNLDAGLLNVHLDGISQKVDLYTEAGISYWQHFGRALWHQAPWQQKLLTGMALIFQVLGLSSATLFLWLLSRLNWRYLWLPTLITMALIFWSYLGLKRLYSEFNAGRAFRDTHSYVLAAEKPISSKEFWIGQRTFTIPLMYKLLDIDTRNYLDSDKLSLAESSQQWLSVLSWTALAIALAAAVRRVWGKLLIFALVLFFSLNLEISFWDSLLLSESVSFSLFALLLAGWIGMGLLPARLRAGPLGWIYFASLVVITILYSFARDTNLYFVIIGGAALLLAQLLHRLPRNLSPTFVLAYTACLAVLFVFQNANIQAGDRWQIHIYDHLALRVLPDPEARQYFAEAGLPISQDLLAIPNMPGYIYQNYLDSDPAMQAVRDWIVAKGRSTFFKYLVSHPSMALLEPIRKASSMINGSNLEYRYPRHPKQPIAFSIAQLSDRFYPHQALWLWGLGALTLACLIAEWRDREYHAGIWWVLAALLLSLYPLMFVVWNGNPLEVERHAAQIGIQLRLAGLVALALILDRVWSLPTASQP